METVTPTADHDLLIKLDTKMDALTLSFQDFHSGLGARVTKTENRLDAMDIYHASIDLKHFYENSQWVDRFRANLALIIALGGIVLATAGGVFSTLIIKGLGI